MNRGPIVKQISRRMRLIESVVQRTKLVAICVFGLMMVCSLGCWSATPKQSAQLEEELESMPLKDVLGQLVEQAEEVRFCVAEGAGAQTFQDPTNRIRSICKAITGSIDGSSLPENNKNELEKTAEELKAVCDSLVSGDGNDRSGEENSRLQGEISQHIDDIKGIIRSLK